MTANTIEKAWRKAHSMIQNLQKDENASERAGYEIFRDTENYYNYVCVLGDRLEVNTANGETVNIWIDPKAAETIQEDGDEITITFTREEWHIIHQAIAREAIKTTIRKQDEPSMAWIYEEHHSKLKRILNEISDKAYNDFE